MRTRLRSFFTLFSMVLIITLYTVLASVSSSFTDQITNFLGKKNIDIVVQARFASSPVTSKIPPEVAQAIKQMNHVATSESLLISHIRLFGKDSIFIFGTSDYEVFSSKFGFRLIKGKSLNTMGQQIVIGEKMANVYGLDVGDVIELEKKSSFTVSGVYSSWLNFFNAGVVIELGHAQNITDKPSQSSLLFLSLDDRTRTNSLLQQINDSYPTMRAIDSLQFPDHLGPIKSMFYFSKVVSISTLFIASAVLLTTLSMAISERTKEVGILRAIGWPKYLIILVVLFESLILTMTGSLIGYLCAYPAMYALKSNFASVYMYFPDSPDFNIFLNVVMMSVFISLASGLLPAIYGTRIEVAKALRYE